MFEDLVESRPHRARGIPQTLVSVAVHTVVIVISIQLTRAVAENVVRHIPATDMVLTRAPSAPAARASAAAATQSATPLPARIAIPASPIVVPIAIPPVTTGKAFDPNRFSQDDGRHGSGQAGPPGNIDSDPAAVITMAAADEAAEYLDGPDPMYPPTLRQVGVEGRVTLRYIVGVDGLVEPASIQVIDRTNASFETAAIEAIKRARFRPARLHGKFVRQLVEQVVRFTLRPA